MLFALFCLLAEEQTKQPAPGPGEGPSLLPLLLIMVVMGYFFLFRAPRRQEAERNALIASLKKNDKVLTFSGIYGTVVSVSDKDNEIVVKVDDNVRLRMTREAIARKIEEPKEGAAKEGGA